MLVRCWNFITHEYEKKSIPDDWKIKFYSNNMSEVINCIGCGKEILFGHCYTSLKWHTIIGLAYSVCSDCHNAELEEWRLSNRSYKE